MVERVRRQVGGQHDGAADDCDAAIALTYQAGFAIVTAVLSGGGVSEASAMSQHTVFVSHAHVDNDLCDLYVAALREHGFDVWYDRTNLQSGHSLSHDIEHELQTRTAFIVLLSPAAVNSYWVRLEIDAYRSLAAQDASRVMIPVCIERCDVPLLLRGLKYIEGWEMPFDSAIAEITASLHPAVAHAAPSVPAPTSRVAPPQAPTTPATPAPSRPSPINIRDAVAVLHGPTAATRHLAWSPQSDRIAACDWDGCIFIWWLHSPNSMPMILKQMVSKELGYRTLSWSPDGRHLVTCNEQAAHILDSGTGKVMRSYTGATGLFKKPLHAICSAWSPDGQWIATGVGDGSYRSTSGAIHVWEAQTGRTVAMLAERGGVWGLSWSPDSARLVAMAHGSPVAQVWDVATRTVVVSRELQAIEREEGRWVGWSPRGASVASSAGFFFIWDATTGQTISQGHAAGDDHDWSPDGAYLVSALMSGADVTRADTGERVCSFTHAPGACDAVAWSPDGAYIASAGRSEGVKVTHRGSPDQFAVNIWAPRYPQAS